MKRVGLLAASVVALVLIGPASAFAIEVNATTDGADPTPNNGICGDGGGNCTLRAAIQTSQGTPGADTITFSSGLGTVELGGGLPTITQPLTITGPASPATQTVDGNDLADRVFETVGSQVQMSDLTITGGQHYPAVGNAYASGIRTGGTVTLDRVTVTDNVAIATPAANTTAYARGGGIYNTGNLTLRDSTVSANFAYFSVPAVANPTANAYGGGIHNNNDGISGQTLLVQRSTVSGNGAAAQTNATSGAAAATAKGGGIGNFTIGSVVLDRATVSGNYVSAVVVNPGTAAATAIGGGVYSDASTTNPLALRSSTITKNSALPSSATPAVAAAANLAPGAGSTARNTIVSEPVGASNCNAPVGTSQGFNLEGSALNPGGANSCGFDPSLADQENVAATGLDSALAANGGPTLTHKLNVGSVAIDKGKASAGETTDQRGQPRPSQFTIADAVGGDGSDIGAYEVRAPLPQFTSIDPGASGSDDTPTLHGTVPDDGTNPSNSTVTLFTDSDCSLQTGSPSGEPEFETPGITANPVVHNATTTFYARGVSSYGISFCSSGPFPGTITYTQQDPPANTTPAATATENPECATLREALKRLNRKIKRADDPGKKAKLKKKRRKVRQRLTALGCAT